MPRNLRRAHVVVTVDLHILSSTEALSLSSYDELNVQRAIPTKYAACSKQRPRKAENPTMHNAPIQEAPPPELSSSVVQLEVLVTPLSHVIVLVFLVPTIKLQVEKTSRPAVDANTHV